MINVDINNVRNPQIKNLLEKLIYILVLFISDLSKKKQNEFYNQDLENYNSLPIEKIVLPASKNLTISNNKNYNNSINWKRSHGNHSSNKFST